MVRFEKNRTFFALFLKKFAFFKIMCYLCGTNKEINEKNNNLKHLQL